MKGDKISEAEKAEVAAKLSRFIGINEDYLKKAIFGSLWRNS